MIAPNCQSDIIKRDVAVTTPKGGGIWKILHRRNLVTQFSRPPTPHTYTQLKLPDKYISDLSVLCLYRYYCILTVLLEYVRSTLFSFRGPYSVPSQGRQWRHWTHGFPAVFASGFSVFLFEVYTYTET